MIHVRAPPKKRAEQAHPPLTETRSAAFPACSDGFDDVDGGPERGVYIQIRSMSKYASGAALKGRRPLLSRSSRRGFGQTSPVDAIPALQLGGAAARAHLGGGGDERSSRPRRER
jgi:hypothetical protein